MPYARVQGNAIATNDIFKIIVGGRYVGRCPYAGFFPTGDIDFLYRIECSFFVVPNRSMIRVQVLCHGNDDGKLL